MSTKALTKSVTLPTVFDDFFKPWNDWFGNGSLWGKPLTIPAANVIENKDDYKITLAAPGLKKSDFDIDLQGNLLTISCDKEENKEEKDTRHTRKEYSFTSFSRSFNMPEDVLKEKIGASYDDGLLTLVLPKTEDGKKAKLSKHITVK